MGSPTSPKRSYQVQASASPIKGQRVEGAFQDKPLPDILKSQYQELSENPRLCENCQNLEVRLERTITKKLICSLEWTSALAMCDLCDIFIAMMDKDEKSTPLLFAAPPKKVFRSINSKVPDSGVILFVGYQKRDYYRDNSNILIMVDDRAQGITGSEYSREKIDYNIIKQFLLHCQDYHKLCTAMAMPIDLQVIDCHSGQVSSLPASSSYIALSYVWGFIDSEIQKPNESLWTVAPKTIRDAMILALKLDIPYLWVDRYCIPQEDGHKKQFLIRRMGVIYSQATLTVIAAAGTDPSYGLPGITSTPRKHRTCIQIGSKRFAISRNIRYELAESKWNSRGWTYQEALLSRRRLVLTNSQFYFQCCAMHCTEAISFPLEPLHISNGQRFPEKLDIWKVFPSRGVGDDILSSKNRIEEFVQRELTLDSDALNAFQGIIEEFKNSRVPVHFFGGIPLIPSKLFTNPKIGKLRETAQLIFGLTWGFHRYSFSTDKPSRRHVFPSWSWLDWKVRKGSSPTIVDIFRMASITSSPYAKRLPGFFQSHVDIGVELPNSTVIPWECNREAIDSQFGDGVIPKYLHIKGWTFDLDIAKETPEGDWKVCWPGIPRSKVQRAFDLCCDIDLSSVAVHQLSTTIKVLMLCSTADTPGILRTRVGLLIEYSDRIKAYERIGICDLCGISLYIRDLFWDSRLEEKSLTEATLEPFHLVKSEVRLG